MSDFEPERGSEAWDQYMAERGYAEPGSEDWHRARRKKRASRPWYFKKRTIIPAGLAALIVLGGLIPAAPPPSAGESDGGVSLSSTGLETADRPMSFEECNRQIHTFADQFGTPITIVDSTYMRTVRFNASDGSILVTCAAAEEKMIIVKSPVRG
ncbi:MAG: hypothetical protein EOO77_26260 [Oxalobacteraceae bacterium]|nr:MAG: hypothetical protein EOO77_26260 [Oxalobacteraceae bacterium]